MKQALGGWTNFSFRLRRPAEPKAVILLYHRVANLPSDPWALAVTPEHFQEHLQVLRRSYHPACLSDLVTGCTLQDIPPKTVVVTFDDGYSDNFFAAKPLLEQFQVPATVFVIAGAVDSQQEFWWDELERILLQPRELPTHLELDIRGKKYAWELGESASLTEADARRHSKVRAYNTPPTLRHRVYQELWALCQPLPTIEREQVLANLSVAAHRPRSICPANLPLTACQLGALVADGLVDIGAHTMTHPSLAALTSEQQRAEIQESRCRLQALVGAPVTSFSYPFGKQSDYSTETTRLVREAGFECACTNFDGTVSHSTDLYQVPRVFVKDCDGEAFAWQLKQLFRSRVYDGP